MYKPPRGFRDISPRDAILMEGTIKKMKETFKKYGFDPLHTPILEKWETLKGKQGAEEKLIFKFLDELSERKYALRYDLTVPLARFFADTSYSLPFKRYQIGRVYRHERPQKGRFREFRQADFDILGSPHPEADAEIINVIQTTLEKLGFEEYEVLINERRILEGIFKDEFDISDPLPLYRIIDKKEKIGVEQVKEELIEVLKDKNQVEKLIDIISIEGQKPHELLDQISSRFSEERIKKGVSHLKRTIDLVEKKENIIFTLSLVRGLGYYTGPVFEAKLKESNIGSVAAGGRYDNLLRIYGRDVSATGASIGISRLLEAGKEIGIFEDYKETETEIYIVSFGTEELYRKSWDLTSSLRKAGYNVETDLRRRAVGSQLDYAKSKNIPVVLFLGPKEIEKGEVTVYVRENEKRFKIQRDNVKKKLKEILPNK